MNDQKVDGEVIFTKTIRLKNGKVLHASAYGLKAFRLVVKKRKDDNRE